jgi:dTDP-4-amino-4,6-dideoxygalactose transaminase
MATRYRIPFNKQSFLGEELAYIAQAVANGHISGDGPFTKQFNSTAQKLLGTRKALLTTSCTHALEMAALLLDIQPGDEVIIPTFTFVSTVNAFVLRGAKPRFIDSRPDTLNMDESLLEGLITSKTRAIIPVHYAGVGCEMDMILAIARQRDIPVVEDNAHGIFGKYKGKWLGSFGNLSALSFHETKNISCGEGGALLINDPRFDARAEIIREKGTNRSSFFRGEVAKYTWVDIGSSYLPSDILAAILCAQLEYADDIQSHRKKIWNFYNDHLRNWAKANGVGLPNVPPHCDQSYHMFYMIMPSSEQRNALIGFLGAKGILAVSHYSALHSSPMGQRFGYQNSDAPVAEDISKRLVRLPVFNDLTAEEQSLVVESILAFSCQ